MAPACRTGITPDLIQLRRVYSEIGKPSALALATAPRMVNTSAMGPPLVLHQGGKRDAKTGGQLNGGFLLAALSSLNSSDCGSGYTGFFGELIHFDVSSGDFGCEFNSINSNVTIPPGIKLKKEKRPGPCITM